MAFDIMIDCDSCSVEKTTSGIRVELTEADPADFNTADVWDAVAVGEFIEDRKTEVFNAIDTDEFLKHHGLELKET